MPKRRKQVTFPPKNITAIPDYSKNLSVGQIEKIKNRYRTLMRHLHPKLSHSKFQTRLDDMGTYVSDMMCNSCNVALRNQGIYPENTDLMMIYSLQWLLLNYEYNDDHMQESMHILTTENKKKHKNGKSFFRYLMDIVINGMISCNTLTNIAFFVKNLKILPDGPPEIEYYQFETPQEFLNIDIVHKCFTPYCKLQINHTHHTYHLYPDNGNLPIPEENKISDKDIKIMEHVKKVIVERVELLSPRDLTSRSFAISLDDILAIINENETANIMNVTTLTEILRKFRLNVGNGFLMGAKLNHQ